MIKKLIETIRKKIQEYKTRRDNKKKIEEINENDPFIYK